MHFIIWDTPQFFKPGLFECSTFNGHVSVCWERLLTSIMEPRRSWEHIWHSTGTVYSTHNTYWALPPTTWTSGTSPNGVPLKLEIAGKDSKRQVISQEKLFSIHQQASHFLGLRYKCVFTDRSISIHRKGRRYVLFTALAPSTVKI